MNPFYFLAKLTFTKPGIHTNSRKKWAIEFLEILRSDYSIHIEEQYDEYTLLYVINDTTLTEDNSVEHFKKMVSRILMLFHIDLNLYSELNKTYQQFMDEIMHRIKKFNLDSSYQFLCKCFEEHNGIIVDTIHGIKGKEFNTIIGFGLLNGLLPHWDYIFHKKEIRQTETMKLLYVLVSRAQQHVYLFSETGRKTKNNNNYSPTNELVSLTYDYDL